MYEKLDMMLMFVPALKAASPPSSSSAPLPDVTGKDVVELGCGTAYFGAWLKKAARPQAWASTRQTPGFRRRSDLLDRDRWSRDGRAPTHLLVPVVPAN